MASSRAQILLRLQQMPRGAPLGSAELKRIGVSAPLAYQYVKRGWLNKLGRGVFTLPADELQRDATLKFLATRMPGLHVGGKTALAWRGVLHNIPARERLSLWGVEPGKLPAWFSSKFASRYVSKKLFRQRLPVEFGLSPLPESPHGPLVSEPERALLEMLSEVGLQQSVEEARHIMEGARSLRPEVLRRLLQECLRVKVLRLCTSWAEDLNLPWSAEARKAFAKSHAAGRGRWTGRMKDGTTLILKP
jgi:hypothetical protein